jgi:hypothetical protein
MAGAESAPARRSLLARPSSLVRLPFRELAPTLGNLQQESSLFGVAHKKRGVCDIRRTRATLLGFS